MSNALKVEKTPLEGLLVLTPQSFTDARGYLSETYHAERYREAGVFCDFLQDNQSFSIRSVLRGLHAQAGTPQAKLVRCVQGEIFDVAVDGRLSSPTFGKWFGVNLSGENLKQLFVPEGFFHGFCVLSDKAWVHYKCSSLYDPTGQLGALWNDPDLDIRWPVAAPILSEKDLKNLSWKEMHKKLS